MIAYAAHSLATTEAEDQVKSGLFLDIIVLKSAAVFELFASEDEALLIWWDALLVLDLGLNVFDCVGGLNIKSDGLASESLNEDLHTTTEAEDQVKSGLFLDVVVWKSTAVFKLFACEDETLLVWRDALLVLDLCLDVFDGVSWLNFESDSLAGQGFDKDLHNTTAEAKD